MKENFFQSKNKLTVEVPVESIFLLANVLLVGFIITYSCGKVAGMKMA